MNPAPQTLTLSPIDLAKTISDLPTVDLAIFQDALLSHMIQKTPGVCGGSARIRNTRIPVWTIASLMNQGADEEELLLDYPSLTRLDLWIAQIYYKHNCQEIDDLIIANDLEDDWDEV